MDLGLKGLAEQLVERAAHRVALTGRRMLLFFLGGLCVLVTLGFLTAALYTWLDRSYGVFIAELGVAAIFLLLGLILMLVGAMTGRRRPPQPHAAMDPLAGLASAATEPIAPLFALVAAFALGFARGLRRGK